MNEGPVSGIDKEPRVPMVNNAIALLETLTLTDQVAVMLRGQVAEIVAGSIFVFIGLATCAIVAFRRGRVARVFVWLGLWSAMYGAAQLDRSPAVVAASPRWLQIGAPYADAAITYLLVVVGSLSFLELSRGRLRRLLQAAAAIGIAIAVGGIFAFVFERPSDRWLLCNTLLATGVLVILVIVVAVPRLSARYLAFQDRRVMAAGTFVFAAEALFVNVARPLQLRHPPILDDLGFAALLFSFGYVALQLAFTNERRLLAVENELEIARRMQLAILPDGVPQVHRLQMSAAYRPMTAVAGDFYEFVPVDPMRVGILVADVAGHGVPAALIASMIKVAMQSVVSCAVDPGAVLNGLNRVLARQLRTQLVSAAYLWIDTESRTARYSAAGHPPLLRWRLGALERIESNGLLFGMLDECDYPVRTLTIDPGDRFLLYTDGIIESENVGGEFFGDARLEEVVRRMDGRTPSECSDALLVEIDRWRPASVPQQDDITLVVVDFA
jgi:sigma-B regulation protein RsbU (phosphoserine phosphatase)